ncbi:hypothetical protein HRR83_001568 [Exophiala dermatitidis]|uniref:Uncharacterized protein n=2 Tax=Exophiala dermatitidis TaxID=5970 RepID=H6C614_EXODN|nr:uncharacterized protein HMPREF1120_07158 [Exophiala dermatitidis NIH/UT8656]KAJ4516240.1 hypothetical protein HRR73_004702 [Exophiala dermatitidis]EHY59160.1 hypothetical protein HMPREF1120_07158 [Exophiala dermatitidis NIH/UT8656]KAJ4526375.1 hypothetical protein HRR74_001572 [Exophiala dermatitidis]KAJ4532384.1 hypothetical protein HRR76_007379 [Exophiala dermatitidis]KAJ4546425.1 hypothetical protein HRR77_004954 [Exophiala dermatitidis]
MRLINVRTMQLEEFHSGQTPPYAILSHRWESEEVSYQDMGAPKIFGKKGYGKIQSACWKARQKGLLYLWVDTCCIDKTSSSELTEAINSMYRWYKEAEVCFAFLADIEVHMQEISTSVWFTRGWTLQELIAPKHVSFHDRNWVFLGTKDKLAGYLSKVTGIDMDVLIGRRGPATCSVAQRMSWAAKRETKRIEDRAYSLLGLFDVSMPMLYGEGEKSFIRLQEEIIKHSDDHSIFAWDRGHKGYFGGHSGLLATSPSQFVMCQNVVPSTRTLLSTGGFSITNVGLSIQLTTIPWAMETYLAILNCTLRDRPESRLGIFLERLTSSRVQEQFARVQYAGATVWPLELTHILRDSMRQARPIHVRQTIIDAPLHRWPGFRLHDLYLPDYSDEELVDAKFHFRDSLRAGTRYNAEEVEFATHYCLNGVSDLPRKPIFFGIPDGRGTVAVIHIPAQKRDKNGDRICWMKFGFDEEFAPMCIFGRRRSLWGGTSAHLAVNAESYADAEHYYGEHALLFRNDWIVQNDGCLDVPRPTLWRQRDFCILRGHREQGLDARISFLRLHISMRLYPVPEGYAPSGRPATLLPGMNVWTININSWDDPRQDDAMKSAFDGAEIVLKMFV